MNKKVLPTLLLMFSILIMSCSNEAVHSGLKDFTPLPQPEPVPSKLTLMVYIAADNDLEAYAISNLRAMEKAATQGVNVLVLLDRAEGYDETCGNWTDTRLFEVIHDDGSGAGIGLKSKRIACPALGLSASENTELDMANPSVLKGFIDFCKGSYAAENYALVIWGHGSGWKAFAIDDHTGSWMSVKALGAAVRGQGLSVIGFDTCFGGVLENLYELKDCASYVVACPGVTPSGGWDYKKLLESFSGGSCGAAELAFAMAESSSVQTGVFDCRKLTGLFTSFEAFSKALSDTVTDSASRSSTLTGLLGIKSYSYTQNPCDLYLDIPSMAAFYGTSSDAVLAEKAGLLKQAVEQASLTVRPQRCGIGVHLISKSASGALASTHNADYVKDLQRTDQCAFIKESLWWVPTEGGNSSSLLDKLFYRVY